MWPNKIRSLRMCSTHEIVKDFSFNIETVTDTFSLTLQLSKLQCVSTLVLYAILMWANKVRSLPRYHNHIVIIDLTILTLGWLLKLFSLTLQLSKLQCVSSVVYICYSNVGK